MQRQMAILGIQPKTVLPRIISGITILRLLVGELFVSIPKRSEKK
jgi:hypothetical protein